MPPVMHMHRGSLAAGPRLLVIVTCSVVRNVPSGLSLPKRQTKRNSQDAAPTLEQSWLHMSARTADGCVWEPLDAVCVKPQNKDRREKVGRWLAVETTSGAPTGGR